MGIDEILTENWREHRITDTDGLEEMRKDLTREQSQLEVAAALTLVS